MCNCRSFELPPTLNYIGGGMVVMYAHKTNEYGVNRTTNSWEWEYAAALLTVPS
jgi:hypothetical protein